jgi:anti-sigma-K factor RskA
MNFHDPEWCWQQAGEYVLSTLPEDELNAFIDELEHNRELRDMVVYWQERLQPLALTAQPVTPPARVWQQLSNRIDQLEGKSTTIQRQGSSAHRSQQTRSQQTRTQQRRSGQPHRNTQSRGRSGDRERRSRRPVVWQWVGSLAVAASLLLSVALWQTTRLPGPQFNAISVLTVENGEPVWVIDATVGEPLLRVTSLAPAPISDTQVHQLWRVKPDNTGVESLGLLPRLNNASVIIDAPAIAAADTIALAISLEPQGGSTQPGPSGPVLYQGEFRLLSAVE